MAIEMAATMFNPQAKIMNEKLTLYQLNMYYSNRHQSI